ncbi:MAG: response regulator [Candidatus Aenigmatarchaeota archaeon]
MSDKKKVMVVDDHDSMRSFAETVLRGAGYETMGFDSAEKAKESWHGYNPDVVLTDYKMPGMDGYQLAESLIFDGYRGKKVLMSGNPGEMYENHPEVKGLFDVYFDGFVEKPFTADQLLDELARVLGELQSQ